MKKRNIIIIIVFLVLCIMTLFIIKEVNFRHNENTLNKLYTDVLQSVDITHFKDTLLTSDNLNKIEEMDSILEVMNSNILFTNKARYSLWEKYYGELSNITEDSMMWEVNTTEYNLMIKYRFTIIKESNFSNLYD